MDAGSVRTRKLTIVAQDPGVMSAGRILKAAVDVPAEELAPGPRGYRVHVIDYDASTRSLYRPFRYPRSTDATYRDPYGRASDDVVVGDPGFHAQNVYAIVMRTLSRFEFALGRRVSWAFGGHQVQVAPHAFAEANAFYSERDQALLFGYFPGRKGTVFSCLSHDVVAHETTHALVDGLRTRYTDPSSPDQAAFHEGFSDIAALLSVFSLRDIVQLVLTSSLRAGKAKRGGRDLLHEAAASAEALKQSALLGLAEQMGEEMSMMRGQPLRRSVKLEPAKVDLESEEFKEPHRRGEVLVAAVMNAFVKVWVERLEGLGRVRGKFLDLERVAEEGASAADYLLTMCIRSLDYCPPVHLEFGDFLSALVTADFEIRPDDSRYSFREHLVSCFGEFDIVPASHTKAKDGRWMPPKGHLVTDRVHFESLTREPDEVFRFVWENRGALDLFEGAYTRVQSVRPCLRIAPDDGFALRETVAECTQHLTVQAQELRKFGIRKPDQMPNDLQIELVGGLTLIFDEFGKLKFAISNSVRNPKRQSGRLQYLWDYGHFGRRGLRRFRFADLHRARAAGGAGRPSEEWL